MMRKSRAFTLVELLIAIAVAAILMMLAAPSFQDFILVQRLKGVQAQLVTDLQYARSEAVGRGTDVYVQFDGDINSATTCYSIFACEGTEAVECRCDCSDTPATCSVKVVNPDTNLNLELRSVRVDPALGVRVIADPTGISLRYDHRTGSMQATGLDGAGNAVDFEEALVDVLLPGPEPVRAVRAQVLRSGRPSACLFSGSVSGFRPCS